MSLPIKTFQKYMTDYPDSHFIIRLGKCQDSFFSYFLDKKKYSALLKSFEKFITKCKNIKNINTNNNHYFWRDFELVINNEENQENDNIVFQHAIINEKTWDNYQVIIKKTEKVSSLKFPNLLTYHDQYHKISNIYQYNDIEVAFIIYDNDQKDKSYSIEIRFMPFNILFKDLVRILNLFE